MKKKVKPVYIPPDGPLFHERMGDVLKKHPHIDWVKDSNLYGAMPRDKHGYCTTIGVYSNDFFDDEHYEEHFSFDIMVGRFKFGFGEVDFATKFFLITLTENMRLTEILYSGKVCSQIYELYWNGEWIEIRNIVVRKPFLLSLRKKETVCLQNNWLPKEEIDDDVMEEYVRIVKSKKTG